MVAKGKVPWNKGNRAYKIRCLGCSKEFSTSNKNIKYCSQKCYHENTNHNHTQGKHWILSEKTRKKQGESQKGKRNHNWKGGITNPRKNKENKKWMRAVKKRDEFCVICGSKKNLKAHHLNGFDKFKKERYLVKNGITLCKKHHEEFHKKYGYGNNTKKQFEDFCLEEIIFINKKRVKNSTIFNICLEGEDSFYANGILTHNTPPHTIRPTNKKSLKWKSGKKDVFAKVVKHPGSRPNPFIRNTIRNKIAKIITEEILKQ